MKVEFKIDGLQEVDNMLRELPAAVAGRIGGRALRKGATVILAAARRNAPVGNRVSRAGENQPGQLLRAIKIRSRRTRDRGRRLVVVTVQMKDAGINPHWIEYGTTAIRRPSNGEFLYFKIGGRLIRKRSVAGIRAHPFMRPAADTAYQAAIAAVVTSIGPETEREAARLARRAAARALR